MSQKKRPIFRKLFLTGLVTAILFFAIDGVFILLDHGFFVPWKEIDPPYLLLQPGESIAQLLGVTHDRIRIQSKSGNAYDLVYESGNEDSVHFLEWHSAPNETINDETAAQFCESFRFWKPPIVEIGLSKTLDEKSVIFCRAYVGAGETSARILEDGTLWIWFHTTSADGNLDHPNEVPLPVSIVAGLVIGLVIGWLRIGRPK